MPSSWSVLNEHFDFDMAKWPTIIANPARIVTGGEKAADTALRDARLLARNTR